MLFQFLSGKLSSAGKTLAVCVWIEENECNQTVLQFLFDKDYSSDKEASGVNSDWLLLMTKMVTFYFLLYCCHSKSGHSPLITRDQNCLATCLTMEMYNDQSALVWY